jgi:hypothetical protein
MEAVASVREYEDVGDDRPLGESVDVDADATTRCR